MKRTLKTKLLLKLFDSEFDKLTLAEMQEIRDIAAARCKLREQAERAEAKKNAPVKSRTTAAGSKPETKKSRSIETVRRQAV
ncbi:MAG: hypothetical protein IJU51_04585 [Clostridia bacterium]|nr:hypothetical protein [Clostridia bacterium]